MSSCVHDAVGLPHLTFSSVEQYLAEDTLAAGLRSITLADGNHLDIVYSRDLVPGDDHATPVFFTGALGDRTSTHPPYFTGLEAGEALDLPVVAVADPIFNVNRASALGWFTGRGGQGFQDLLTQVLGSLRDRLGHVLLVGGCGGGFVALQQAERLSRGASVFAWNPQTDLLRYLPATLRAYLAWALDDEAWLDDTARHLDDAPAALRASGIENRVDHLGESDATLVIQNTSDWHVDAHARPLARRSQLTRQLKGARMDRTRRHMIALSSYGQGHAPITRAVLESALRQMTRLTPPDQVYEELLGQGALPTEDLDALPWGPTDPVAAYRFHGREIRLHGIEGDAIFEHVHSRKEPYEAALIEELLTILKPGELVVDVGANIGNHSIALAVGADAPVLAFEPLPLAADLLEKNVQVNGLADRVRILRQAVGSHAGHAAPTAVDERNIGATQFRVTEAGIEMVALDDMPLPPVQLIKVDAEGMDVDVLRGATALIERDRPWIVCEASSAAELDELDEVAADLGYAYVGRFNATPTFLLMPARPGVEALRMNRRLVERLTATNLLARDLNWRVASQSRRLDELAR